MAWILSEPGGRRAPDAAPAGDPPAAIRSAVRGALRGVWHAVLEAVLPADCPLCGDSLPGASPGGVCPGCWSSIPFLRGARCSTCGVPMPGAEPPVCEPPHEAHGTPCARCLSEPPPFDATLAVALFEGPVRAILHRFKFSDQPELAGPLADMMAAAWNAAPPAPSGLVVAVPQRLSRRIARGYNPAAMLAARMARRIGWPLLRAGLRKTRRTADQATLPSSRRAANLGGAFGVTRPSRRALAGRTALLVDDVMTTGATAAECSRTLLRAGAARVVVAVFARTPHRPRPA